MAECHASGKDCATPWSVKMCIRDRDGGLDTLEANLALGFAGDQREYYIGAQILRDLGVKSMHLLTNNPDKVYQLSEFGLEITRRVPIQMEATPYDLRYLRTKQRRMGHILNY